MKIYRKRLITRLSPWMVFLYFGLFTGLSWGQALDQETGPDRSDLLNQCGRAEVGVQAPWFSGWTLDEQVFNIRKPFKEEQTERVALVFWASWCVPCRKGLQRLVAAQADLLQAGVSVVLVNVGEKSPKVSEFVSKFFPDLAQPFTIVLDPYGNSQELFLRRPSGQELLPLTVILDKKLKVLRIIGTEGRDYVDLLLEGTSIE